MKDAFEGPVAQEFFVPEKLMELLDEHKSGRVSNMQKIWSFYTFIVWYEGVLRRRRARAVPARSSHGIGLSA